MKYLFLLYFIHRALPQTKGAPKLAKKIEKMVNFQLEHVRPQILTIPKIIQVDKCGALSLIQFKKS